MDGAGAVCCKKLTYFYSRAKHPTFLVQDCTYAIIPTKRCDNTLLLVFFTYY